MRAAGWPLWWRPAIGVSLVAKCPADRLGTDTTSKSLLCTVRVLHPLFVHLHIAFLLMAFVAMYTWLVRGLATSVFEDRIYRFSRANTWAGVVTVALSMVAGLRDAFFGTVARFSGPIGGWLLTKVVLSTAMLAVYGSFLYWSGRKRTYLQEDRRAMLWCLGTQAVGMSLVGIITMIGTMIVFYQDRLARLPLPFGW